MSAHAWRCPTEAERKGNWNHIWICGACGKIDERILWVEEPGEICPGNPTDPAEIEAGFQRALKRDRQLDRMTKAQLWDYRTEHYRPEQGKWADVVTPNSLEFTKSGFIIEILYFEFPQVVLSRLSDYHYQEYKNRSAS